MVLISKHCTINGKMTAKLERILKVSLKDIKIHLWKDNLISLTITNWNTQQNLHSIGSIYKNDPNAYEAENMGLKEII